MTPLAELVEVTPHWSVPVVLLLILAASGVTFWLLVRRWTRQRHWLDLSDWADANGFHLRIEEYAASPEALRVFGSPPPRVLMSLNDKDTTILQMETTRGPSKEGAGPQRWNVLVRRMENAWPTTGLRPVAHGNSLLDLLSLSEFPSMLTAERFVVFGLESASARALARSSSDALLPPDVGLLLTGHHLILDFSTRVFDHLEIGRLDDMAEQVVSRLPAVQKV